MNILSILLFSSLPIISNFNSENGNINLLLETRWILYHNDPKVSPQDLDTLILYPFESPKTENLHPVFKYAGLTFECEGVLIEHVWNKCATGNPPDHFKATWSIIEQPGSRLIKIEKSIKWNGEYIIVTLEDQKIVLLRKQ